MKIAERPARRRDDAPPAAVEVSIVMPCLNEAATLPACIAMAREAIANGGYSAEIIVADNGSSDGSQPLARELGARVIDVQRKGYGSALIGGIDAAQGRFVVMGDADASYDFAAIAPPGHPARRVQREAGDGLVRVSPGPPVQADDLIP